MHAVKVQVWYSRQRASDLLVCSRNLNLMEPRNGVLETAYPVKHKIS